MTRTHFLWQEKNAAGPFRTAVSLHSHTLHSHESLAFLPRYARRIPIVSALVAAQEAKYHATQGRPLDYGRAYWTPPLPAHAALALERSQIESLLDRQPLVSITDHDSIEACQLLRAMEESPSTPVSLEWTVPLSPSFIHLGIHNLPPSAAPAIARKLARYTAQPQPGLLKELLVELHEMEDVLIVFNHPLWDEARAGMDQHRAMARAFVESYGEWIHAFELNGLRPARENRDVLAFAAANSRPAISGGDRHGTEPNVNLNLTNAATFAAFVDEIRREKLSEVLFLPAYREPAKLRHIEMTWDTIRNYPEFPGRVRLLDRIFWESEPGAARPLSGLLRREPGIVKCFVATMRLFNCARVKSALRAALAQKEEIAL